jgi:hypothetical protein
MEGSCMTAGDIYWSPICELAARLRCWSRARINDGQSQWTTDWGQLLILPVDGYLEVSEGPYPIRHFDWVQLSTVKLHGGLAGRPLEFHDVSQQILVGLKQHAHPFEVRDESWSLPRFFENEPVKVIHFVNPFRSKS